MPELPEVQTTVDGLNRTVRGKVFKCAWVDWPHKIKGIPGQELGRQLKGAKIIEARRLGKNIFIKLDNDYTIHAHLKMTGHFLFGKWKMAPSSLPPPLAGSRPKAGREPKQTREQWQVPRLPRSTEAELAKTEETKRWIAIEPQAMRDDLGNRFIRLMFTFTDGTQLALCDMRRFAKVGLYPTEEVAEHVEIGLLGPDPLDKDFKPGDLANILKNPTARPIKQFLMDQTKIAGIGNIYSDEILWRSGIHPRRKPASVTRAEIKNLHKAMQEGLRKGLDMGGDSDVDFRNIDGERGRFQETHRAYRCTGKPCGKRDCGGTITREVIGARSAHYCSVHQV